MGLFRRKKKDEEAEATTAETDALSASGDGEAADGGEAAGAQATAVHQTVAEAGAGDDIPGPPPEHKSRLDNGDEAAAPEKAAEPEAESEPVPEPEPEPEPEVETPPPAPAAEPAPQVSDPSRSDGPGQSPLEAHEATVAQYGLAEEKPELLVAGAFLGGLVLAQVIRWMGGDDD